nr:hypothetical protein Iba_chr07fCG1210 [Ipomoea batatas]
MVKPLSLLVKTDNIKLTSSRVEPGVDIFNGGDSFLGAAEVLFELISLGESENFGIPEGLSMDGFDKFLFEELMLNKSCFLYVVETSAVYRASALSSAVQCTMNPRDVRLKMGVSQQTLHILHCRKQKPL